LLDLLEASSSRANIGAGLRQFERNGAADAPPSAGDNRDPATQVDVNCHVSAALAPSRVRGPEYNPDALPASTMRTPTTRAFPRVLSPPAMSAVPTNNRAINSFYRHVGWYWCRALRRRGQTSRLTWQRMKRLTDSGCHPRALAIRFPTCGSAS
jgi:hypothetical protein